MKIAKPFNFFLYPVNNADAVYNEVKHLYYGVYRGTDPVVNEVFNSGKQNIEMKLTITVEFIIIPAAINITFKNLVHEYGDYWHSIVPACPGMVNFFNNQCTHVNGGVLEDSMFSDCFEQ